MSIPDDPARAPIPDSAPVMPPGVPAEIHGDGADDIDGHSIEELGDYLDSGRFPPNESIDGSPGCQIALTALARLRVMSVALLEAEALDEPAPDEGWIAGIINNIGLDARAGRDIPVQHPSPGAHLTITEGAVRGMIRAAGDAVGGVLIGRCTLDGDVTVPGEPITVTVEASVLWGARIVDAVDHLRQAIYTELIRHTELSIAGIDVTIHDVLFSRSTPDEIEKP